MKLSCKEIKKNTRIVLKGNFLKLVGIMFILLILEQIIRFYSRGGMAITLPVTAGCSVWISIYIINMFKTGDEVIRKEDYTIVKYWKIVVLSVIQECVYAVPLVIFFILPIIFIACAIFIYASNPYANGIFIMFIFFTFCVVATYIGYLFSIPLIIMKYQVCENDNNKIGKYFTSSWKIFFKNFWFFVKLIFSMSHLLVLMNFITSGISNVFVNSYYMAVIYKTYEEIKKVDNKNEENHEVLDMLNLVKQDLRKPCNIRTTWLLFYGVFLS